MEQDVPNKVSFVKLELSKRSTLFEFALPDDIADNVAAYTNDTNVGSSDISRHIDFLDGNILIAKGNRVSFADISHKGFSAVYDDTAPDAAHDEGEPIVEVSAEELKFSSLDIVEDYRVVAL